MLKGMKIYFGVSIRTAAVIKSVYSQYIPEQLLHYHQRKKEEREKLKCSAHLSSAPSKEKNKL